MDHRQDFDGAAVEPVGPDSGGAWHDQLPRAGDPAWPTKLGVDPETVGCAIDGLDQNPRSARIVGGDEVEGVVGIGDRLPGPADR